MSTLRVRLNDSFYADHGLPVLPSHERFVYSIVRYKSGFTEVTDDREYYMWFEEEHLEYLDA